jgi:hypothetical protein
MFGLDGDTVTTLVCNQGALGYVYTADRGIPRNYQPRLGALNAPQRGSGSTARPGRRGYWPSLLSARS